MRSQRLEVRVNDLVERVLAGGRIEDDRVEAKSIWLEAGQRCARQIAGLANANGGEPVLWIVGLDEDGHRVVDPGDAEAADWWAATKKWFAELAPGLTIQQVPTAAGSVTALEFDSSRAPYLVKTSGAGGVDREVPWREGNSTRSAHRSELLRTLVAEVQAPALEPIGAYLRVDLEESGELKFALEASLFVEAFEPCRLPKHKWDIELSAGDQSLRLNRITFEGPQIWVGGDSNSLGWIRNGRPQPVGSIYSVPDSAIHVNGSDRLSADWRSTRTDADGQLARAFHAARRATLRIRFPLALSSRVAETTIEMKRRAIQPLKTREVRRPGRQVDPTKTKIDTRIALFEVGRHGGDHWWWDEGGDDVLVEAALAYEVMRRGRLRGERT